MTAHSAADIAAELRRQIPDMGEVKLQKLLYYVQGRHLEVYGEPAFSDEIVAYDMGPVVTSVWRQRNNPPATSSIADENLLLTVGYVVSKYGQLYGNDLIDLTHAELPWLSADDERQRTGLRSAPISLNIMRDYFTAQGRKQRNVPDELFELTRHRRNFDPLPPSDPMNADELLRRVGQGV